MSGSKLHKEKNKIKGHKNVIYYSEKEEILNIFL